MRRPTPHLPSLLAPMLAALALVLAAIPATSSAAPHPAVAAKTASATQPAPLSPAQQHYLSLARNGVAQAKARWSDKRLGWYDSRLGDRDRYPLATIWDIVTLFAAVSRITLP